MANFEIIRRTAAQWTAGNYTLLSNQIGVESSIVNSVEVDTGKAKLGDGITPWNTLGYWAPAGAASGNVTGPASAVSGHLAVFSGATGKIISDGGAVPTGITNSAGANVVTKSDGTNIVASKITDDGTDITLSPPAAGSLIVQQAATPTDDIVKVLASDGTTNIFKVSATGVITVPATGGNVGGLKVNTSSLITYNSGNNATTINDSGGTTRVYGATVYLGATLSTEVDGVSGKMSFAATNTPGGTTGAQTINKPTGSVNFAAAATSLVVTNSLVSATSKVFAVVQTNDSTAVIKNVVCGAGSFTITLSAAATAETQVAFFVIN